MLEIVLAETAAQYRQIRELLEEYIAWDATQLGQLGPDVHAALDFYFASGKEELPGVYAPPDGRMLLASYSAETAGCAAFRRMTADTCEMKRMYVRPGFRGKQMILTARETGYSIMRSETTTYLDKKRLRCTLPSDSEPASLTAPYLKTFGRSLYV